MKTWGYLTSLVCAVALALAFQAPDAWARKKPNIVLITADDYGQISAQLYNPRTEDPDFPQAAPTPNLADLAKQGVAFENGWAMPVCSTTRGTITLGKLPTTSGIGGVIGGGTPYPPDGVSFPPAMVDPNDPNTLQKLAQNKGYRTYKVGKWHEIAIAPTIEQSVADVLKSGFDDFYGQLGGFPVGGYAGSCTGGNPNTGENCDPDTWTPVSSDQYNGVATKEFLSSALVTRSIELIDGNGNDQPFFLRLDFPEPHWPYEVAPGPGEPCPADFRGDCVTDWKTLDEEIHADVIQQVREAWDNPETEELEPYPDAGTRAPFGVPNAQADQVKSRAAFKSLIAYMDLQIGRLLEHVDLKHSTVFFLGDNGTQGGGAANNAGNPNNVIEDPVDPLKTKSSVWRNGYEVPFIVAGEAVNQKGRRSDVLVSSTDVYATVLQLIGQNQPKDTRRDSISFFSALRGKGGGSGSRRFSVAEWFGMYPSVGGVQRPPTANEGRVVGTKDFRLQARPVIENGAYICREGFEPTDEFPDECFNPATGIYEKSYSLFFFDLRNDPLEDNALLIDEMSRQQRVKFRQLCRQLNRVAKNATYIQNGTVCELDGSNLSKPNNPSRGVEPPPSDFDPDEEA